MSALWMMKVCSTGCLGLICIAVAGLGAPLNRFLDGAPYKFCEWMNEWKSEWSRWNALTPCSPGQMVLVPGDDWKYPIDSLFFSDGSARRAWIRNPRNFSPPVILIVTENRITINSTIAKNIKTWPKLKVQNLQLQTDKYTASFPKYCALYLLTTPQIFMKIIESFVDEADHKLFKSISQSHTHVLQHLFIVKPTPSCSLLERAHNFILPLKDNRNFVSRALYNALCPPLGWALRLKEQKTRHYLVLSR